MAHSNKFKCYIISENNIAIQYAKILLKKKHHLLGFISPTKKIRDWALKHNIPCIESLKELYSASKFDYLFSIINSKILPESILRLPQKLAINYHDSLLPKYAGLHATSWALLNKEKRHGITWHIMSSVVDEGDILKQIEFDIDPYETAFSLNIKCYEYALLSFNELVNELEKGEVQRKPQDLTLRSYYSLNTLPPNGGLITWSSSAEDIEVLCRALSFGNYPNTFATAKFLINNQFFILNRCKILDRKSSAPPGTIVKISDLNLEITTNTSDIAISNISDINGKSYIITEFVKCFNITKNARFTLPPKKLIKTIEKFYSLSVKSEIFWQRKLLETQTGDLLIAFNKRHDAIIDKYSQINFSEDLIKDLNYKFSETASIQCVLLTGLLVYFYRLNNYEHATIAFSHPKLQSLSNITNSFIASHVPLAVKFTPEMSIKDAINITRKEIELLKDKQGYFNDIFVRYPDLIKALPDSLISVDFIDEQPKNKNSQALLALCIAKNGKKLFISKTHYQSLYANNKSLIKHFRQHIINLFNDIAKNEKKKIHELSFLTKNERRNLLKNWNDTFQVIPANKKIYDLFVYQANKSPDSISVICGNKKLSYSQLLEKSCFLNTFLLSQDYISTPIVIFMERSIEYIVSVLGVLKSNTSYVPLDITYPVSRIKYIIQDSKAAVILTKKTFISILTKLDLADKTKVLFLEDIFSNNTSSCQISIKKYNHRLNDIAYIAYTSGSTGNPKGVLISHTNVINYSCWFRKSFALKRNAIIDFSSSIAFDLSVACTLVPLMAGATIAICDEHTKADPYKYLLYLSALKVTHIECTPAYMNAMLSFPTEIANLTHLQWVLLGADALVKHDIIRWLAINPNHKLINEYGPTECTVAITSYKIPKSIIDNGLETIPIGKPAFNTKTYILDKYHNLCPIGMLGELCIAGKSVSCGYLNLEDQTRKKFINNLFDASSHSTLYKTGDIVRYLDDGNLDFIGRRDSQIKIRGFRVDINEVENCLLKHPFVKQVALDFIILPDKTKKLIAYLVLRKGGKIASIDLRQFLKQFLPEYMIPSNFIVTERFPLTSSGKIDKRELANRELHPLETQPPYVGPSNIDEQILIDIWQNVLSINKIGINDNFFDLGGHSLAVLKTLAAIQENFSIKLSPRIIFESPTVADLALAIKEARTAQSSNKSIYMSNTQVSPIVTLNKGSYKCPLFLIHPVDGTVFWYKYLAKYLNKSRSIYAIQDPGLEIANFHFKSLSEMASFYLQAIRKIQPHGPYLLGGASFGSTVAFEIANQLKQLNEQIFTVFSLDGWAYYPQQLSDRDYFKTLMHRQNERLYKQFNFNELGNTDIITLQWDRELLLQNYSLPVIDVQLTLLKAQELWPIFESIDSPYNGWEKFTISPVRVHPIPGTHETMFWEPNVQTLAKVIDYDLDKIEKLVYSLATT